MSAAVLVWNAYRAVQDESQGDGTLGRERYYAGGRGSLHEASPGLCEELEGADFGEGRFDGGPGQPACHSDLGDCFAADGVVRQQWTSKQLVVSQPGEVLFMTVNKSCTFAEIDRQLTHSR